MMEENHNLTRGEHMLRQVAANLGGPHMTFEEFFVIDESLPAEVTRQIATPADATAALACWSNMMFAAIDRVVHRLQVHRTATRRGGRTGS
jgi:hypothetical protein